MSTSSSISSSSPSPTSSDSGVFSLADHTHHDRIKNLVDYGDRFATFCLATHPDLEDTPHGALSEKLRTIFNLFLVDQASKGYFVGGSVENRLLSATLKCVRETLQDPERTSFTQIKSVEKRLSWMFIFSALPQLQLHPDHTGIHNVIPAQDVSNCFDFAFSHLRDKFFKRYVGRSLECADIWDRPIEILTKKGYEQQETPEEGDLVVYMHENQAVHFGIYHNEHVLSKWGHGFPIFEHEITAFPDMLLLPDRALIFRKV